MVSIQAGRCCPSGEESCTDGERVKKNIDPSLTLRMTVKGKSPPSPFGEGGATHLLPCKGYSVDSVTSVVKTLRVFKVMNSKSLNRIELWS